MDSCHHTSWLGLVPKSQYMRHNCTEYNEFLVQAEILTQRFLEKGYSIESLTDTFNQVKQISRADLLIEKPPDQRRDISFKNPFITCFSNQHRNIKHIINKHWHILGNDRVLNTILPVKQQPPFRGAPFFRDNLALDVLNPSLKKKTFP